MLKLGSDHITLLHKTPQGLLINVKSILFCLLPCIETTFSDRVHSRYHILYQPNSLLFPECIFNPKLPISIHALLPSNCLLFTSSVSAILAAITLFRIKMPLLYFQSKNDVILDFDTPYCNQNIVWHYYLFLHLMIGSTGLKRNLKYNKQC